jgi:small subunit ribosomal protein S1
MSQDSKSTSEFGALFEAHLGRLKTDFKIGDRVKGTVTAVDRNSVFVDIGSRCDALIDRPELTDDQGQVKVKSAMSSRPSAWATPMTGFASPPA